MIELEKSATSTTLMGPDMEPYLALVRAFPLVSIRDDRRLDEALTMIDGLIDTSARTDAEEAYLGALTDLVETYENMRVVFPPQTGAGTLESLMEENSLNQRDLAPILGTQSIVSEVLSGKRKLTTTHIEKLAAYFHVSPAVFFDDVPAQR